MELNVDWKKWRCGSMGRGGEVLAGLSGPLIGHFWSGRWDKDHPLFHPVSQIRFSDKTVKPETLDEYLRELLDVNANVDNMCRFLNGWGRKNFWIFLKNNFFWIFRFFSTLSPIPTTPTQPTSHPTPVKPATYPHPTTATPKDPITKSSDTTPYSPTNPKT